MSEKTEFPSGAHRSASKGRGSFVSIPQIGLERLAIRCEFGDELHGKDNWKKGIPLSSYANSALRHLNNYLSGNMDEDHLASVGWNVLAMASTENMIMTGQLPEELDDIGNVLKAKRELEKYATSRGNQQGEEKSDSRVEASGGQLHQDSGNVEPECQNSIQMVLPGQQDNWAEDYGYSPIIIDSTGETDQQLLEGSNNWREWEGSRTYPEVDSGSV